MVVKVGIIGLGFMGATHATALSHLPDASLAAVCATNEKHLSGDLSDVGGNLGTTFGQLDFSAVKKYRRWQQVVDDEAIDVVDICLPTEFHAPVAKAALAAGRHVFCEKPMALNDADCEGMIEAARKSKRLLMVGQVLRFFPAYKKLKGFVQSGEWGRVRSVTFVRRAGLPQWSKWLSDDARSGGAILDLLVHDIDQVLWLFGAPDRISAKSIGEPDTMMATFIYPDGPEVRVQGGWFAPETPFSMSYQVRFDRAEVEMTLDGVTVSDEKGQRQRLELSGDDPYASQLGYFLECCRTGTSPLLCPPEESARAVQIASLLKQSRAEGGTQLKCSV